MTATSVDRLIIVCDIHGQMKYRMNLDWWDCQGFDGDWCMTLVKAETLAQIELEAGRHYECTDFYPGEDMTIPKSTWHLELKVRIVKEDEWMRGE